MPSRPRCRTWSLVALLACALAFGLACSDDPEPADPVDAGRGDSGAEAPDAGTKPCGDCDAGADAGTDAGEPDAGAVELKIKQVVPSRGPATGGTDVTIEGGGFYQGFASGATAAKRDTRIYFGGNEASDFRIIDDDTLEVTAPPCAAGPADVIIQNPNGEAICESCFTYYVELQLTGLSPKTGPLEGGVEVELTGAGFGDELVVLFGQRASPQVTIVGDRTARALVPAAEQAGAVDVRAFNKNGTAELRWGFRYEQGLSLIAVHPPYGPLAGGAVVAVRGAGLAEVEEVLFGAAEAVVVRADDATLEVIVPAAATAGAVDVSARAGSLAATLPAGYVYFDPEASGPAIAGVRPTHGRAEGGEEVLVVGTGLDGVTEVRFGAAAAVPTMRWPDALMVATPPGTANTTVDVAVVGEGAEGTLVGGFHYNLRVETVSPDRGSSRGGEEITIDGEGFTEGLEVFIGALPAQQVALVSPTRITAITPPGSGGASLVRVRDAADPLNEDALDGAFTYVDPLMVGRISPDVGAVAGGTYVTVLGTGFEPGVIVEIGGSPLKDMRVLDGNTIVGRTPPGAVGAADVVVRMGEARDETPGGFTYFNPKLADGGSSGGPINGTLNVTVLESGGYGAGVPGATVMLGYDPATPFQGRTDRNGQITFSDPSLVKAQTVTVFKEDYLTVTVARQESQNLTVFLTYTGGAGGGGGPPGFSPGTQPAIISGRVAGFKLPRPLQNGETAYAEVWVAPSSVYATPPIGSMISPAARDARGERWRVTQDGGTFSVFASKGLRAVYAVFGIFEHRTQKFTPVLLGVRRGVMADPEEPAVEKDIVLNVHLDASVPITIESAPIIGDALLPALNETYAWLELGGEGVIPLGKATSEQPQLVFTGLPRLDGSNFIFLNRSSRFGGTPESYCFRKQLGDLSAGVTIGPMLGLLQIVEPRLGRRFEGRISWRLGQGPPADLARLTLSYQSATSYSTVWQVVLPGTETSVSLPPNVSEIIGASNSGKDKLYLSFTGVRAPRFDYHHWGYSHFSLTSWTCWTTGSVRFDL
ncbi:MAG: IPT/TIG domain-containing protein [Myxococcales bacterium]|jgi:hypothetical protein